jgi:hypothetical protein
VRKDQINKIRDENWNITTNSNEIQKIMREYYENLYRNKLENRRDNFLNVFDLPKLKQENL